jgi:hypothetical protein
MTPASYAGAKLVPRSDGDPLRPEGQ